MKKNVGVEKVKKGICILGLTVCTFTTLTGCSSTKDYKSILDKNEFTYELSDDTAVLVDSNITDEDVTKLSPDIRVLGLFRCNYITDLSLLPAYCPDIQYLIIDKCASLEDLSFIYELDNLCYLDICESPFISDELVDYLNGKGIIHTIDGDKLKIVDEVDKVLSEIINESMSDEDKIKAITQYVIETYKYDKYRADVSNEYPLTSFLGAKRGVCASYAYLTNVLLRKADINSYEIVSDDHGWNVIELDGKYYYLDTTNMKILPFVAEMLLDNFNVGFYYMTSPAVTSFSVMDDYDNIENVIIPNSLIEDIRRGEDEKNIMEKYKNSVPVLIIQLLIIVIVLTEVFYRSKEKLSKAVGEKLVK